MPPVSRETVVNALSAVKDPRSGQDLVGLGWVNDLAVKDGHVVFGIELPPDRAAEAREMEPVRVAAEKAVHALPGVLTVSAVLTASRPAPPAPRPEPAGRPGGLLLPEVKAIVAVASGKGGVGKSTTAANLAVALGQMGLSVGLFDADIYGPSMPLMFGLSGAKPASDGKVLQPLEAHGLKLMSIGFMVPEDSPVIWRGPMVMGALEQLMRDVAWGALDVMVVDMPPGTGDTQLTMSQRVPLAGAVIVSTPQDVALADARKGLAMFRKVNVPVLGLIENMSYYVCPNCGHRDEVFGHGGAKHTAEELDCDFLGAVPLDIRIRVAADSGAPITIADPESPHARAYQAIAAKVWDKVKGGRAAGPRIIV